MSFVGNGFKFEIPPVTHSLAATTAQCSPFSLPEPLAQGVLRLPATSLYRQTATTVEPTKEEVTIEMDDCIVSNGEVSTTKMKSNSYADNVPVSMSEEEEAQMESEDEEKDSKAATAPTIEGKVPFVSLPVNEEDKDEEDNDDNDNDEEDDDDDVGDKEDNDDDDNDNDDGNNDDDEEDEKDEEDIFDFNLNDIKGMSEYELMHLQRIHRNEAKLTSLGLLEGMTSTASPSSNSPNRKKRAAPQGDFVRRVQPKRNVFKPTSYKDLDDPVISKRTRSTDSSDTGEEDTGSKRMDEAEYSPSGGDEEEEDDNDELECYNDDNDNNDDELDRRFPQAKADAAVEALADHSPSTGHSTAIYGHSQQYYLHQNKYVAFLQELLSGMKRFPSFPKDSDGTVIVDTHPDYAPPHKDEVIGDNKCQGTHGNFSSKLQCGPISNKNGKASCFTFDQMLQLLSWINSMYSLRIINHSDDILPSQIPFKDEHRNDFCTKINLLDKYTLEETCEE